MGLEVVGPLVHLHISLKGFICRFKPGLWWSVPKSDVWWVLLLGNHFLRTDSLICGEP